MKRYVVAAAMAGLTASGTALAQGGSVADFYKGKTVRSSRPAARAARSTSMR
jgi:F0F1-type ATP synthase membrane subunit c/vacuolar-type H+-ATPase subunit K